MEPLFDAAAPISGFTLVLKPHYPVDVYVGHNLRSFHSTHPLFVKSLNHQARSIQSKYGSDSPHRALQITSKHVSGKYYYYDVHPKLTINKPSPDDKDWLHKYQGLNTNPFSRISQQDRILPKIKDALLGKPEVNQLFQWLSQCCHEQPNAYVESAQTDIHNNDCEIEIRFENPFAY
jgi:hypothetical protein